MITYIKGILVSANTQYAVVDVQGIGYAIFIPGRLLGELPAAGHTVQFHTSFIVREASQALYGFLKVEERDLFDLLLNVSGVGPKLSLSLIGHLPPKELQSAIASKDLTALSRVPGVGKKTAERLVVELKDKLPDLFPHSFEDLSTHAPNAPSSVSRDALLALINLGYSQQTAAKAVNKSLKDLPEEASLSSVITAALQHAARN